MMGGLMKVSSFDACCFDCAAAVARGPKMQQMSEAIPFMEKPAKIDDSMPGMSC